jgi:ABC-type branched-subunit amino acid transport system substrate-binding protein
MALSCRSLRLGGGLAALLVVAVAAAGCGSSSGGSAAAGGSSSGGSSSAGSSSSTYTIPIVADLTGPEGTFGTSFTQTTEQVIKNAGSSVNGHPIKFDVVDTQSEVGLTQSALRQAISGNPVAILQAGGSSAVAASQSILTAAQIPLIIATDTETLFQFPWYIGVTDTAKQAAAIMVNHMQSLLGGSFAGKKVALVQLDAPSAVAYTQVIKAAIKAGGGTVVDVEQIPLQITSFSAQAQKITSAHADGVFVMAVATAGVPVAQALTTAGFHGPIVSWGGSNTDAILKAINLPNFSAPRLNDETAGVAAGYSQTMATGPNFAQGYAAATILLNALKSCSTNPCTSASMLKSIYKLGVLYAPGKILFGPLDMTAARHTAVFNAEQFYKWNGTSAVPDGSPIPLPVG